MIGAMIFQLFHVGTDELVRIAVYLFVVIQSFPLIFGSKATLAVRG